MYGLVLTWNVESLLAKLLVSSCDASHPRDAADGDVGIQGQNKDGMSLTWNDIVDHYSLQTHQKLLLLFNVKNLVPFMLRMQKTNAVAYRMQFLIVYFHSHLSALGTASI